jgi:hypothetical protein
MHGVSGVSILATARSHPARPRAGHRDRGYSG